MIIKEPKNTAVNATQKHSVSMKCNGDKLTCKHEKKRNHCEICTPNRICKHEIRKSHCVECSPTIICEHEVRKNNCLICTSWRQYSKCKIQHGSKDDYCVSCHPEYIEAVVGKSKIACKFFDELEKELNCKIQHYHADNVNKTWIGKEYRPSKWKQKPVDGFISHDKLSNELLDERDWNKHIIIEFLGIIYHGHPSLWHKETNHLGMNLKGLFEDTEQKLAKLTSLGYVVFYVWENEYRLNKGTPADICRRFIDKLEY